MSNNKPTPTGLKQLPEGTGFATPSLKRMVNGHERLLNSIDAQGSTEVSGYGNRLVIRGRRFLVPIYAQVTWASGSSDYAWQQARRDSAGTGWEVWDEGMKSTDTGQTNAVHESGFEDLPDDLLVIMQRVPRAAPSGEEFGTTQWLFDVPLQRDSTFVHRTVATASPTAGSRTDLTMTTAELTTEAASAELNWDMEGQGNSMGVVYTVPSRAMYYEAGSDEIMYGYICDIELDVMGRQISRSEEMRYTIHIPDTC